MDITVLKARLQTAGRHLLVGEQSEAITQYLRLRDDITQALRVRSEEGGEGGAGVEGESLEPKLTLAEALKNLSVAFYQRAAYVQSASFAEDALKCLGELDDKSTAVVKARTRVKLCLVKAYFVQPPSRERYDRMGFVLGEEEELPLSMAQYKVAIDFRLEQRDQDVVVEHSNLPENRKCLRFYFQPKDLPLYRPHLRRVEYSVLSAVSSHGANNRENRARLVQAFRSLKTLPEVSVLTYQLSDGFLLFQLLTSLHSSGEKQGQAIHVRCVERSDRHVAYLVYMLALLQKISTSEGEEVAERLSAAFYFFFCSPVVPQACFAHFCETVDELMSHEDCPLPFLHCSKERWGRIITVLGDWQKNPGEDVAQLIERQSFSSLIASRQGCDEQVLEQSRKRWKKKLESAQDEQLCLFGVSTNNTKDARTACSIAVDEAPAEKLARLEEFKAVLEMPGAEEDALYYETYSRLPLPPVLSEDKFEGSWRPNPLHESSLYGIPLYNVCLKLVQTYPESTEDTSKPPKLKLTCFGWASRSISALADCLQRAITNKLQLTVYDSLESMRNVAVFDVVLLDPPMHRSCIVADVLRILPWFRKSGSPFIATYCALFNSAKEASLLGMVQNGSVYRMESPRDRSLTSPHDVKPWLYELFMSIVKPALVNPMTDASYSLAFFLKVLERILALKHPRALVLDILEEITNLDSKNGYSLEPIMLETMIQIALWLPRVNINFLSSYKLPSVYDILKFAVRIEVVQRRVEQTSQRIGLALLDTSVITASALKSQPFQQCIATNPRHIHVFSVIVWDRTNEVFSVSTETYMHILSRRSIRLFSSSSPPGTSYPTLFYSDKLRRLNESDPTEPVHPAPRSLTADSIDIDNRERMDPRER